MKHSKNYRKVLELVDSSKVYSLAEACELVKKTSTVKFDATVDVSFHMNVDTTKADQQIRGTLILPHGNGKTKKICAITSKVEEAKNAGADFAGGKDLLEKIQKENWFDFDVIVATPEMMGELGKMGRLLGPKGLMPNPKTGTVAVDIAKAIKEIKLGKVEYRLDKNANMSLTIGRVSFAAEDLVDNLVALTSTLVKVRPAAVKGSYIKTAVVHTTMGPSIRFNFEGM
ncbi:MAG: 50S ribosomal protein L1 [Bacilli bacterium]|nr:50S ribosomal protein L1 [Erysipelotrichaceae bacterium]MDY5669312.1 50S ribosomal protein L1 [Bacilli bacterium]